MTGERVIGVEPPDEEPLTKGQFDATVGSGGFLAPHPSMQPPRYFAVVTIKPRLERIRCWLRGEPGFDIDVYDRTEIPSLAESLPKMTAVRGGVEFK